MRCRQKIGTSVVGRLITIEPNDHSFAIINLRLIQRQLDLLGYKTDTATNGIEALQKWQRNSNGASVAAQGF